MTSAEALKRADVAMYEKTLDFLGSVGVDFSQGFFTSPPVPIDQTGLVRKRTSAP